MSSGVRQQKAKTYDMYSRFFRWASDRLDENGVLALITNRSFIDSRTFDGFRAAVAEEFSEIRIVDLGGDVRANPQLNGGTHNRSEEHTSELQSLRHLVCRLLLEK